MHIAYDVSSALKTRSGVGHYTSSLLAALGDIEGLDLRLYALTISHGRLDGASPKSIKRLPLPGRLGPRIWTPVGFPSAELLVGRVDAVHGTNFWVPPLPKRNGVVTIHDLMFLLHPELASPTVRRYTKILPKVLESCGAVIAPTSTIARGISAELGFPLDRIKVTYEGVRGVFSNSVFEPRHAGTLGIERDYVLFAGQQHPRKNLVRLVNAFNSIGGDLQLVLVGPKGPDSAAIGEEISRRGLEERVVRTGYLNEETLGSLMKGAKAFVFPSLYEGFGLPPLEAMAAGVPVIASRAGSLPEVLGDAPFWCEPLDEESIASAMEAALSNESARMASITAGAKVAAGYTWERTAALTVEAYRMAAGGFGG